MISPNLIDGPLNSGRAECHASATGAAGCIAAAATRSAAAAGPNRRRQTGRAEADDFGTVERIFHAGHRNPNRRSPRRKSPNPKRTKFRSTPSSWRALRRKSATTTKDNSRTTRKAISSAIKNLRSKLSPGMTVDMPGDSTVAYCQLQGRAGERFITTPGCRRRNRERRGGHHGQSHHCQGRHGDVSSRIITPSGNAKMDDSVQPRLEPRFLHRPASGRQSRTRNRNYTIDFNLKTKQSLE